MREEPDSLDGWSDPDFEIRASWSARSVRRQESIVRTTNVGDVDRSDEFSEASPRVTAGKRWRLRAWLRDPTAR